MSILLRFKVFFWAVCFYGSLYFIHSNLEYLIVSVLFFCILYILLGTFVQSLFVMFVAVLPFAKGKNIEVMLLPKGEILRFALFDVVYYFPIYLAQILLFVIVYLSIRSNRSFNFKSRNKFILLLYGLFLIVSVTRVYMSQFPRVIIFSVVELLFMIAVFQLPYILRISGAVLRHIAHTMSAFVLFQTTWVLLQRINHGPLGRDIEARNTRAFFSEGGSEIRYSGTFYEASILGAFMLTHVVYFSLILIQKEYKSNAEKWIYFTAILGCLVSIVYTGSRGIYFLTFLYAIYFIWRYKTAITQSLRHVNLRISGVFLLLLVWNIIPYLYARIITFSTFFTSLGSGTYRMQIAQYAVKLAENNWFGIGLNLSPYYFATAFSSESFIFDPAHPHNIFFQILAESGPIGLCIFILFIWSAYRPLFIRRVVPKIVPYAFASVAFLCAAQFYPIFISQPEILSFFFLYSGIMSWKVQTN